MSLDAALTTATTLGLPTSIDSTQQLASVLDNISNLLAVASSVSASIPTVDRKDAGFTHPKYCPSYMGKLLPPVVDALDDVAKQSAVNTQVLSSLTAAVKYTKSAGYKSELLADLREDEEFQGWMKQTLEAMVEAAKQDGELQASATRKKRETDLEVSADVERERHVLTSSSRIKCIISSTF